MSREPLTAFTADLLPSQSNPPIPPISGLTKKRRYSEIGGIGSHNSYLTYKTLIWDLEMGGGIGGEAVLGGAVLGGTTVLDI